MAIRLEDTYPGKIETGVAGYPDGKPQNVTVSGDGTGTPWEKVWQSDIAGFLQKILVDSGITASGTPDTTLLSDYMRGFNNLFSRIKFGEWEGLLAQWNTADLQTTTAGRIMNQANTVELVLPANLQKDLKATWAEGAGLGGIAQTVALPVNGGPWLRKFLSVKADLSGATLVWDTDVAAANFFAAGAGPAAGYTDATLFRRVGWNIAEAGDAIAEFVNTAANPRFHIREPNTADVSAFAIPVAPSPRVLQEMRVPPNTILDGILFLESVADVGTILVTSPAIQADSDPLGTRFTLRADTASVAVSVAFTAETNSSSQIGVKGSTGFTGPTVDIMNRGFTDNLQVP